MKQGNRLFRHSRFIIIISRRPHRTGNAGREIDHFGLSRKRCFSRIIKFASPRRRIPRPERKTMTTDPEQATRNSFHRSITDHFGNTMHKGKHRTQHIRDRIHVFRNKRGDSFRSLPVLFPSQFLNQQTGIDADRTSRSTKTVRSARFIPLVLKSLF